MCSSYEKWLRSAHRKLSLLLYLIMEPLTGLLLNESWCTSDLWKMESLVGFFCWHRLYILNIWWYHVGNKSSFRWIGIKVKEFKIKPFSHGKWHVRPRFREKILVFLLSAGTLSYSGTTTKNKIAFLFQNFSWCVKYFQILLHGIQWEYGNFQLLWWAWCMLASSMEISTFIVTFHVLECK